MPAQFAGVNAPSAFGCPPLVPWGANIKNSHREASSGSVWTDSVKSTSIESSNVVARQP